MRLILPRREVYVSLHTADPALLGWSTEVCGGGYERSAVAPAEINRSDIRFPEPTADWGLVTHFGIWDQPLGPLGDGGALAFLRARRGNLLRSGALTRAVMVNGGDLGPKIRAGGIRFEAGAFEELARSEVDLPRSWYLKHALFWMGLAVVLSVLLARAGQP